MAWIKGQLSPREKHHAFSSKPDKTLPDAKKAFDAWDEAQLKLIGASAQWYASRPGVDLLLRYYQEAASQFGLKLASEPRLYPEAKQGAKEALCYEALVKLDGYEDKAVALGLACNAPGNADGGHAVAMFIDKETLIHFFDPNFGEFVINKDREGDISF